MKLSLPEPEAREVLVALDAYRAILDGITDPIFQHDSQFRVVYANRAYLQAAGLSAEEVLGRPYWTLFPKLDQPLAGCQRAVEEGTTTFFEEEFTQGDRVYVSRTHPLPASPGGSATGIHILVDVTQTRHATKAQAELAAALEQEHRRLTKRVKELHCLHTISALAASPGLQLEQLLARLPPLIVAAYRYAEVAVALVEIDQQRYASEGYRETEWTQQVPILVEGQPVGRVAVAYLEERPAAVEGPFLTEERQLLDTIAWRLATLRHEQLTQAALRESETRYRTLYEMMEQGVIYQDCSGRIIDANLAAQRILGRPLDQLRGRSVNRIRWQAVREDGSPLPVEEHPSVLALRENLPVTGILGIPHAQDRRLRWILVSAIPVRQAGSDRLQHVFTTYSDITELRSATDALTVRNRAIEASRNGIAIIDAQLHNHPIVYANPALSDIVGRPLPQLVQRPAHTLWAGCEAGECERILAAIDHYHSVDAVLESRRPDGHRYWAEIQISPVRDSGGGVTHFVAVVNDISERRRYEEQLEFQAQHDALTSLPNRNLLQDRLRQAIAYAKRHSSLVGVLFLDVDHFKLINDALGHDTGDRLLLALAQRLREVCREEDTISRYGGDEFVLLLPELGTEEELTHMASRLFTAMDLPFQLDEREMHITLSIGASIYPKDGTDAAVLLRNADTAMYRAKEAGRDNLQFYTERLNANIMERLLLGSQLRNALAQGELLLHYQPQFDLRSGRICGAEALLRWHHPEQGMIPPSKFIPVAEETGLILPIGEWVLEQACTQAAAWRKGSIPPITIAVNLSVRQLEQADLVASVAAILQRTGLDPAALDLEITESAVMRQPEETAEQLLALKRLGLMLSLDDFGTGYSSLAYLRRFAFHRLKIDHSFIRDIITEPNAARIALTIIAMSQSLGMRVLAEGVETDAQAKFLHRHACDEVQGYLMSKPLPAAEFEAFAQSDFVLDVGDPEGQRQTLLLVDDEANITRALTRSLRRDGYHILVANTPHDALELLACHPVQVIVSDQRMPEMTGTELLARVKEIYPDIIRIVLSGYTELKTITDSVNRGAIYKFLTKPWEEQQLRNEVAEAFRHYARRRSRQNGSAT